MKKKLKKIWIGVGIAVIAAAAIFAGMTAKIWSQFRTPRIVGTQITRENGTLEEVSREWFADYMKSFVGWKVPPEYRIREASLDSVEILEETPEGGYIQLDYTIRISGWNQKVITNLELIGTGESNVYIGQTVLRWTMENDRWEIAEKMRPVQYQIQTQQFQDELNRPRTEQYPFVSGKEEDCYISDGVLFVTYDGGASFYEVPGGYEKICREPNGTYDEWLAPGSYVVTAEFSAFVGYSIEGTELLFSTDEGKTWNTCRIFNGGYKANTFLSVTDEYCYVTFAAERVLGSDYYVTFRSSDMETWESVPMGERFMANLNCVYWTGNGSGYFCCGSDIYRTIDEGENYQEIVLPGPEAIVGELGYNPFRSVEYIYEEEAELYLIVGQGEDGDYVRDGKLMKGLYASEDGENFVFVEEIADTAETAG